MKNRILAGIMTVIFSVISFATFCVAADSETKVLMAAAYDAEGNDQMNPLMPAELAIDQDGKTCWTVFSEAVSGYIVIDLGEKRQINTVRFTDLGAKITDYTLEYSDDAAEWKELSIGSFSEKEEKTETFPTVKARYVKLCINNSMTEQGGGFRIGEIEIYYDADVNIVVTPGVKRVYKDVLPVGAEGKAIALLADLNIANGDENGYFKPNAPITRGEFAQFITNIFAEDMRAGVEPPFVDVEDSGLKQAVSTVYTYGLMYGDGDGYFRPNDTITGAEAIKIVTALLGYSSIAEENGGYFNGYFITAAQLGILKGTNLSAEQGVTRKQAALLLANSFDVELLDVIGVGADDESYNIYAKNDNTLLSKYGRIYKERGIVTANELTALDRVGGLKKGMVQISGKDYEEVFFTGTTDAADYLGYQIEFYYQMNGSNEDKTIRAFNNYKTEASKIAPEDVENYADGVLTYYRETKSTRKSIYPTAPVIKNGVYMGKLAHALTLEDFSFSSGEIVLIDNNSDGRIELVSIQAYSNGIVETVSESVNLISLKGEAGIPFDFNNEKNRIIKEGQVISAEELKTFDVVSYMSSVDGETTTVFVSPYASVEGTPEEISASENSVVIDGAEYKICGSVNFNSQIYSAKDFLEKISLGTVYTFYFNIEHKIAGVFGGSAKDEYGYLVDTAYSDFPFDAELSLKIFTQSGSLSVFRCERKVEVGGAKISVEKVYDLLCNGSVPRKQMIRFTTNKQNKITKLTLPDTDAGSKGTPYRNDDALIPYGDPYQFVKQRFYWKKGLGDNTDGKRIKEFTLSDSTIVFQIPDDGNEKNYRLLSKSTFSDGKEYYVLPYNVDITGEAAILAVGLSSTEPVDDYGQVFLVTDVSTALDQDGMPVRQISCASKGSRVSFQCGDDVVVKRRVRGADGIVSKEDKDNVEIPVEQIQPGTLIQYSPGGTVQAIQVIYPLSGDCAKPDLGWRYTYGWGVEKTFGKVMAVNGSNIAVETGGMISYYTLDSAVKFHAWDVVRQKETDATSADILSAEHVGEDKASYFFYAPYTKSMFVFNF